MRMGCAATRLTLLTAAVSSTTPTAAARAVFMARAIITLPIGCTTARSACGTTTYRSDWKSVRPSAREASTCPTGTVFTPERTASATYAASYTVSTMMAVGVSGSRMPASGSAKTASSKRASSGTLMKNWTYRNAAARSTGMGLTRAIVTSTPRTMEPTPATTAISRVVPSAWTSGPRLSIRGFIVLSSRGRVGYEREGRMRAGVGDASTRIRPVSSGAGDGPDLRGRRDLRVGHGAERGLPRLAPLAALLDVLQPVVDELLEVVVTVLEADAVRLLGERLPDHLDLLLAGGVARQQRVVLHVRVAAALDERLDGRRVGAERRDGRLRGDLRHLGHGRRVRADDDVLAVEVLVALDVLVVALDGDGQAGLEVRAGEVDLLGPLLGDRVGVEDDVDRVVLQHRLTRLGCRRDDLHVRLPDDVGREQLRQFGVEAVDLRGVGRVLLREQRGVERLGDDELAAL